MMQIYDRYVRRLYRGGRPSGLSRVLNRVGSWVHSAGVWPRRLVTLQVRGRRTGRLISFPLIMVELGGERYLVSMLGERANWVHNLRATRGAAVLCPGRREVVRLEEVDPALRPPIRRRYLAVAPGARLHFPVDRRAAFEAFEPVSADFPVFRVSASSQQPLQ